MKIGDRCVLSQRFVEGLHSPRTKRRKVRYASLKGEIVGESRDREAWWVTWDNYAPGNRDAFHKSFIVPEPVETGE